MGSNQSKDAERLLETIADHGDAINCMAMAEDSSLIATGSEDMTVRMWSTKTDDTECLGVCRYSGSDV